MKGRQGTLGDLPGQAAGYCNAPFYLFPLFPALRSSPLPSPFCCFCFGFVHSVEAIKQTNKEKNNEIKQQQKNFNNAPAFHTHTREKKAWLRDLLPPPSFSPFLFFFCCLSLPLSLSLLCFTAPPPPPSFCCCVRFVVCASVVCRDAMLASSPLHLPIRVLSVLS